MLHEIFYCKKWGGGFLLLLCLFPFTQVSAQQCPLDVFEFEIVKIPPTAPWKAFSLTPMSTPGAFNAYYQVNLKAKTGFLPTSIPIVHLAFNGKINLNHFTSRVDLTLSDQFSPQMYKQYLDFSSLASGEVNWEIGTETSCMNGEGPTNLTFPPNSTSVRLFTIVLEAVPGEVLSWSNFTAFLDNCNNCMGPVPVKAVNNNTTQFTFPQPAVSSAPFKLNFEYAYDAGLYVPYLRVVLKSPLMGLGISDFGKVDGVIHIVPEMLGSSQLDLEVPNLMASGFPSLIHREVRKNSDGSFDVYFSFEDFPDPNDPNAPALSNPQFVLRVSLNGLYNTSQGGILHCTLTAGRWTVGPLNSNPTTYQLNSVPADINIPGEELCDPIIKITGTPYKTVQDCSAGIRFVFTHSSQQPIELSRLAFQFRMIPGSSGDAIAGLVSSTVQFAQTDGQLVSVQNGNSYFYLYEHIGTMLLQSGAYVDIPFDITKGCVSYFVTEGEAIPANATSGTCALDVVLGPQLCDPRVSGKIMFENGQKVRDYRVRLETIPTSNYELEEDNYCQDVFSFCPDPAYEPFRLKVLKQPTSSYLCGVTTYDCVLISKQVLGFPTLDSPYKRIAGNANLTTNSGGFQAIATNDATSIRLRILGVYPNDFGPNSAPSWYYIKELLNLPPDPLAALIRPYETANTIDVPTNGPGIYNFFAVKVGDVNLSCADYCRPTKPESKSEKNPAYCFKAEQLKQDKNRLFIPVMANAPFDLIAAQAGFRFDPSMMRLINVVPNPELPIGETHFGRTDQEDGVLRFAWYSYDGETLLPKKGVLFTLEFELNSGIELPSEPLLWVSDNILESLIYSENGTEYPARMDWNSKSTAKASTLGLVVNPNPFQENITAFIYSENPCQAKVRLSDSRGFSYLTQEIVLSEGDNSVELQASRIAQPGVYFLSIESNGQVIQRRVVKL